MGLLNSILTPILKRRISKIQDVRRQPFIYQQKIFKELIESGLRTEWGKSWHYSTIDSHDEYKRRIPLQDYSSLFPYIDRMMKGEQQILWPSKIRWFAKSSGTSTGKSKFIPVSKEALNSCHYKAGRDVMSIYLHNNPISSLFDGKGLVMGGSTTLNEHDRNAYHGDISAILMRNMPYMARYISTPEKSVLLMDDWERKLDQMAELVIKENVTHLVGVPTWTIVLLKKLLDISGASDISKIFPHLELYIHGGVSFSPYRSQFRALILSSNMEYLETYNASEGFFGIQESSADDDLLLLLDHGIFYEFQPIHSGEEQTVTLQGVEKGIDYIMIISTNSGLWRYKIGDTIQFTSLDPFKIKISGRTTHFINVFGEEVIVANSDAAIEMAANNTNSLVSDYTVAPVFMTGNTKGGHEWVIEFEKQPEDLDAFTKLLDDALKAVNSDYEAKRFKNIALEIPKVNVAPKGTFYKWMKSKGKLGGQNKVPRLSNNRQYLEEILNAINT